MKFGVLASILVIILAVIYWPASAQNLTIGDNNFRNVRWGQSPLEIEELETGTPFFRDESLVIFRDTFEDKPADIIYFFLNGKLVMGFVHLLVEFDDLNDYFPEYEATKTSIITGLGEPDVENWQMSLAEMENDPTLWGDGLGFGLVKVECGWLLGDTGVALRLSGGKFSGHLMLIHFSLAEMNAGRVAYKEYFARKIGVPNDYFGE